MTYCKMDDISFAPAFSSSILLSIIDVFIKYNQKNKKMQMLVIDNILSGQPALGMWHGVVLVVLHGSGMCGIRP